MTKKAPVLWVVVDRDGCRFFTRDGDVEETAISTANVLAASHPQLAPFRVVKYVPAPKKRKNRK